jgi:hypothetical protein
LPVVDEWGGFEGIATVEGVDGARVATIHVREGTGEEGLTE